jgi:hypothetical protein
MSKDYKSDIFQEAYYGKTKILLEAEKCLNQIVLKVTRDPSTIVDKTPENIRLQALLKKQFGFKEVNILWNNTPGFMPNACTLIGVESLALGNFSYQIDNKNGYYDSKHINYCVVQISSSMITYSGVTGSELLAIILHEIGHNFDASIYNILKYVFFLIKPVEVQSVDEETGLAVKTKVPASIYTVISKLVANSEVFKRFNVGVQRFYDFVLEKLPSLNNFLAILNDYISNAGKILSRIAGVYNILSIPQIILMAPISHIGYMAERKTEIFADSFATVYGYTER